MPREKLTKEQIENIRGYATQIRTISDFSLAVRQNPGQYIGYLNNRGFINMIREVYQNSMDELQKDDSPCTTIRLEYYEANHTVIVSDNGRGVPHDNMKRIFTEPNTSSNYDKKDGEFSAGLHGVGSKVTNALSSEFFAESYLCKEASLSGKPEARRIEFIDAIAWEEGGELGELPIPNENNLQGTKVEFRPSYEIMGEITTTCEDVLSLITSLLPLMKIGAVTDFYGIKENGTIIDQHIVNEDGIVSFLVCNTDNPLFEPVVLSRTTKNMKADIAFTYDCADTHGVANILSFANTCPTVNTNDSTHVSGFTDALTNYFRNYMNKIYLNKSKTVVVNNDIKYGLRAVVSVSHIKPLFSGQAKEIFSNRDIIPFIKSLMIEGLDEWCKARSSDLQKVCMHFKGAADLRMKSDKEKVNMAKRYTASALTGLPAKYDKPNGDKNLELIIVEGDSAKGPCETARCAERQGIFPLKGKPPNAMVKSTKDFIENDEANGIMHILGGTYGKNFDINKCKFEKIIILCDADLDGLHIRTLLLKMFLVYYVPLVEAGRIYGAVPPLYHTIINKKSVYFPSKHDLIKYTQSKFSIENKVFDINKKHLSGTDLVGILSRNSNYIRDLNIVADNYAIDPYLLEFVLSIRNLQFNEFKKRIKSNYRFLNVELQNGTPVLDGLLGEKCPTVILNQNLLDACAPVLHYIDGEHLYYNINGEQTSLYGLMNKFSAYQPAKIDRFKGLGEMSPQQLRESTLHPDYNRTLLRYTVNDIKREIEEIREIECNKNLLFKDIDIAAYEF